MYFWSLRFGSFLDLVPKLILLLGQSLKLENRFYFGPCRQPTNRKYIRGKQRVLLANMALTWILKYYLKNLFSIFEMPCQI